MTQDLDNLAYAISELESLEQIRTDPVWFAEEILNLKGDKYYLDEWQKELLESLADVYRHSVGRTTKFNTDGKSMITVRAMHGPGKTFTVAAAMHWFNCAFKGRIICTAPKEKQLKTRLWPAFRKITVRAGKEYATPIKIDGTQITWHNDEDWCAIAETASQPENLAGYHDDYMLVIVDEASGVKEDMYPVIEGMVSTGIIVIVLLIGNPTKNQGTFHASHNIPKVAKNYYQVHVDLNKTTRVSKSWVQRMIDKYGKDSPVVKVRCLGEFADSDKAQLIAYSWLVDAADAEIAGLGETIPRLRIAVDVADGGDDFTVITAAHERGGKWHVLKQRQFSFPTGEAPILTAQAAIAMFNEYDGNISNGDDIVCDGLGVGAGAVGTIMMSGIPVVNYKGGSSSDDKKQWRNRRTQSYIVMRDVHRDRRISYAEDFLEGSEEWDEFTAQMCSVRIKPGVDRVEDLETKESMTSRGIASPNRADSIAELFATQMPTSPIQLEVVHTNPSMASQGDWN